MRQVFSILVAALVALGSSVLMLGGTTVFAETKTPSFSADPAAVKSRLENVRRLVASSSGARRIIESRNSTARTLRNQAELQLRAAEIAYEKGDMATAQTSLQKATEEMFAAIREIGTGQAGVDKQVRDFESKAESVDVLLNAIDRVAEEKGGMQEVRQTATAIRERASAAKALADQGKLTEARTQLDGIYDDAKHELERLREGETLVRTLDFGSPEEEYHYELDRNDTHQMLLKVLLSDRESNAGMQKLIDNYVGKSGELRGQAEAEAGRGDFKGAVKSLEEATRYLQRAIRSAGVYIPG